MLVCEKAGCTNNSIATTINELHNSRLSVNIWLLLSVLFVA
jgi:hypothetical protein